MGLSDAFMDLVVPDPVHLYQIRYHTGSGNLPGLIKSRFWDWTAVLVFANQKLPKISVFCARSQNNQQLFEK